MAAPKKSYPKPTWINDAKPRWINDSEKKLYAYFCVFGPNTCWQWNCRLLKKFQVSRATIKRRLKKLHDLALITIENPGTIHRRIHPVYYPDVSSWLLAAQAKKISDLPNQIGSTRKKRWLKSEPQEVKSTPSSRTPHNGRARKPGPGDFYNDRSVAAGLAVQGRAGRPSNKKFTQVWVQKQLELIEKSETERN